MDHGHSFISLGSAGFWLFIAALIAVGAWEKAQRNAQKHETLRRIVEKTGTVDEAKLKELFDTPPSSDWLKSTPGDGYRALRIGGTIVLSIAAGLAIFFVVMVQAGVISRNASIIGLAASGIFGMFGAGLFFSSRFAVPPLDRGNGTAGR